VLGVSEGQIRGAGAVGQTYGWKESGENRMRINFIGRIRSGDKDEKEKTR
jgi:hypothetical protein